MNIDEIKNIAVIGAGDMGHGIAEVTLLAGYKVNLFDIDEQAVSHGASRIFESVEKFAEKGKVPPSVPSQIRNELLHTTTDLEQAVGQVEFVIEAVPEVFELKQEVFRKIDAAAPPLAVFASNTSTMTISGLATCTGRPEKVLGMHFFNPAVLMRLVEVIRGKQTSEATLRLGMELGRRMGKVPVYVHHDTPGFIANRVNQAPAVLLQEMLERGEVQPEPLDAFVRSMGSPMGPCELTDYVGIDVAVNASHYFADKLHPDYGPPPHLIHMIEKGQLGKKTGSGYFDWSKGRPAIDLSKATRKLNPLHPIIVQINEATKLVEEGVCSVNDVDLALINSTGNPIGPISVGRQISKWDLADQLRELAQHYQKSIFEPTQRVLEGGHKH